MSTSNVQYISTTGMNDNLFKILGQKRLFPSSLVRELEDVPAICSSLYFFQWQNWQTHTASLLIFLLFSHIMWHHATIRRPCLHRRPWDTHYASVSQIVQKALRQMAFSVSVPSHKGFRAPADTDASRHRFPRFANFSELERRQVSSSVRSCSWCQGFSDKVPQPEWLNHRSTLSQNSEGLEVWSQCVDLVGSLWVLSWKISYTPLSTVDLPESWRFFRFSGGTGVNNPLAHAGDARDLGLIPDRADPLE